MSVTTKDYADMLAKIDNLVHQGDTDRDALSYIGALLQVEMHVKMGQFDRATQIFEVPSLCVHYLSYQAQN